jgi:hypothetical protein
MRLARNAAILLAFIALAAARPMHDPEVTTDWAAVNAWETAFAIAETEQAPFRCDSAQARDCFEMFQRHSRGSTEVVTVASAALLDRVATPTLAGQEPAGCLLDTGHRGDRCPLRSGR